MRGWQRRHKPVNGMGKVLGMKLSGARQAYRPWSNGLWIAARAGFQAANRLPCPEPEIIRVTLGEDSSHDQAYLYSRRWACELSDLLRPAAGWPTRRSTVGRNVRLCRRTRYRACRVRCLQ